MRTHARRGEPPAAAPASRTTTLAEVTAHLDELRAAPATPR
ncbi:hypothetical protein ACFV23_17475 [Streptomyces sp. NPDC059627]